MRISLQLVVQDDGDVPAIVTEIEADSVPRREAPGPSQ